MSITRYKHQLDFSFALGATLVYELLECRPDLARKVYLSKETKETDHLKKILGLCKKHRIPVEESEKAFRVLSPKGNCYIIAEFDKFDAKLTSGNHIVLVNPSDAGNVGTIIRTATGLGIDNIAIIKPSVDIYDPKVIRASMGAIFHVNIQMFANIDEYRQNFSNHLYAFMLDGAKSIREVVPKKPFSLIFGNEASGLLKDYADFCETVLIPQTKNIDSYSLPISAGIAMYDFLGR